MLCNNSAVQDGANIQEGTTNISFIDCEFIGNGRCGIDIWDQTSSGYIEGCTVTDNRQQNFKVNGTFTMLRNNVPSHEVLDSLGWKQNILDDATYYIKVLINSKEAYLTNSASSAKAKFSGKNNTAPERQHWQVTHDGEGYKITSVFDGRYLNEKQEFVTNTYDAAWNTFNIYTSTNGSTAIQTAGCAVGGLKDAMFWSTSGTSLVLEVFLCTFAGDTFKITKPQMRKPTSTTIYRKGCTAILCIIICALLPLRSYSSNLTSLGVLTTEDGLSSNSVKTIYRDKTGYVYFGTSSGLDRYDGARMISIPFPIENIREKCWVSGIVEAGDDRLYVGNNAGLFLFDKRTLDMKQVFSDKIDCEVTSLLRTPDGKV